MTDKSDIIYQTLYQRGIDLLKEGKTKEAKETLLQLNSSFPRSPEIHFALGNAFRLSGDFKKAVEHFTEATLLKPDFFAAHFNLGSALKELKLYDKATVHLREALRLKSDSFEALLNIGLILKEQGKLSDALDSFQRASRLRDDVPILLVNMAEVYSGLERYDEALSYMQKALHLSPDSPDLLNGMGNIHVLRKDPESAKKFYVQALNLRPDFPDAYHNLGIVMRGWDRIDEAVFCFRNALRFNPGMVSALLNLGECLLSAGEEEASVECFRKVLDIDPECSAAADNLLLAMNYDPAYDQKSLFEEHIRWFGRRPEPVRSFANDPDPRRPLKIGYVSPDFCRHPAASFLEPLILNHNRDEFKVFCYSQTTHQDQRTEMFKKQAQNWREIERLDDNSAVELIKEDKIDILIDCAGHMNGNRLGIFALRAAPVQISGIGYPNTTGLKSMDYRLTDAIADPPGEADLHTEKLIRLESGFCCYAPPESAPDVSCLPALENGFVTFGSTHTLSRLNKDVLRLWADVLDAVDKSRLLVFRSTLSDNSISRLRELCVKSGIDPDRIGFRREVPSEGHLKIYSDIDLLLDTFPWSGHTTSCEALWMGVPVITLRGDRHAGRMVSSVLDKIGLREAVAESAEEYVKIARRLTSDLNRLALLRASLREKMKNSELCDGAKYTGCLEKHLREIWIDWCERQK